MEREGRNKNQAPETVTCGKDCGCKTESECQFSNVMTMEFPEKIFAIEYGGYWDFNLDGMYGPSLLNIEDTPNTEAISNEMAKRYNEYPLLNTENNFLWEENKRLKNALIEIQDYSLSALHASIIGTMIRKIVSNGLSQPKEETKI